MAEEDNVSASLFFGGEHAVVVGIEETEDVGAGLLPAPVLEDANVSPFGDGLTDVRAS